MNATVEVDPAPGLPRGPGVPIGVAEVLTALAVVVQCEGRDHVHPARDWAWPPAAVETALALGIVLPGGVDPAVGRGGVRLAGRSLIGRTLARLGVPEDSLAAMDRVPGDRSITTATVPLVELSVPARELLGVAQDVSDLGCTWGQALLEVVDHVDEYALLDHLDETAHAAVMAEVRRGMGGLFAPDATLPVVDAADTADVDDEGQGVVDEHPAGLVEDSDPDPGEPDPVSARAS